MNISKMTIDEIIALLDGELKASCGMGFEFRSHQIEAIKIISKHTMVCLILLAV